MLKNYRVKKLRKLMSLEDKLNLITDQKLQIANQICKLVVEDKQYDVYTFKNYSDETFYEIVFAYKNYFWKCFIELSGTRTTKETQDIDFLPGLEYIDDRSYKVSIRKLESFIGKIPLQPDTEVNKKLREYAENIDAISDVKDKIEKTKKSICNRFSLFTDCDINFIFNNKKFVIRKRCYSYSANSYDVYIKDLDDKLINCEKNND